LKLTRPFNSPRTIGRAFVGSSTNTWRHGGTDRDRHGGRGVGHQLHE
jgi:hypothetical protein